MRQGIPTGGKARLYPPTGVLGFVLPWIAQFPTVAGLIVQYNVGLHIFRTILEWYYSMCFYQVPLLTATTMGGSVASFAALLSSRASDASDTLSGGQMSNSHSQSSAVALLAAGARISSVTELYGGVHASDVASGTTVRDDASSRAYRLTAAALYRDMYGSELSVVSDEAEDASKGAVDDDVDDGNEGDEECEVEREDRLTHTVTIEESVI